VSISHDDAVTAWGAERIRVFPAEHLEGLGLDGNAREALGEVGVPVDAGFLFSGTSLEEVPLAQLGRGMRFGTGWNDQYDMAVAFADGHVYSSHHEVLEITFVNGDMLVFLEFLLRAGRLAQMYEQTDEGLMDKDEYFEEVDRAVAHLRGLDPEAFADKAWWSGVLDEFKMI